MTMLPFTIKITNHSPVQLRRISAPDQQQDLDIDVQIHIHSWEVYQLHTLREGTRRHLSSEILREVQGYVYEAFITFLRSVAEPETFLPADLLNRYRHRRYCLILSPDRSRELFEIYHTNERSSRNLVTYGGYDLVVDAKPQLLDTEAYLIAPNKYTLFMRQINEANTIKAYRSSFVDLIGNTPPPLDLHAQDVIDAFQNGIGVETEQTPQWQQLLIFPMRPEKESPATITRCPACGGPVQRIGGDRYFCLDCDWDNLPPLQ